MLRLFTALIALFFIAVTAQAEGKKNDPSAPPGDEPVLADDSAADDELVVGDTEDDEEFADGGMEAE